MLLKLSANSAEKCMTSPISAPIKKADLYHTVEISDAEGNQDILARSRGLGYEAELIMQLPLPRTVKTRRY